MKKFFAVLAVFLMVVVGSNLLLASTANAAPASVSVASATTVSAAKSVTVPLNVIGNGGGIKPAAQYTSCYWAMDGAKYCYRYACTYFERVAMGCRDGWVRVTNWYA